jgi:pyrroloquinoline quinone biosynthesis protein E
MPTHDQVVAQAGVLARASVELRGILNIDYVLPGACSRRQDGWTGDMLGVLPDGKVLTGHNAEGLSDVRFESVREMSLADIWYRSENFNRNRCMDGTSAPCGIGRGDGRDHAGTVESLAAFIFRRNGQA